MDIFRTRPAPTVRIHESHNNPEELSSSLASPSNRSASSQAFSRPMPVPNARQEQAPPPLPPPRHIPDLAHGYDPGWTWGNNASEFGKATLAPIRQGSSMQGGYLHSMEDVRDDADDQDEDQMDIDTADRRGSSVSTLRSYTGTDKHIPSGTTLESGSENSDPGASHGLQSERPLAQRSLQASSHDYDKHLLAKFGRPSTLAKIHTGSRSDSVPNVKPSFPPAAQGRSHSSIEVPASLSDSPGPRRANTSWGTGYSQSPPTWNEYSGFGGPASAGTAPSSASDLESWQQTRTHRDSYDHGVPPDVEVDKPSDEGGASEFGRRSSHGQKRRRSPSRDQQDAGSSSLLNPSVDGAQRYPSSLFPRSHEQYQSLHGSVSSVSSSAFRQGSYTSSTALSVGRSSVTSISTFDRSPGRISPRPDGESVHDSSYSSSMIFPQNVASLPTRTLKPATVVESKSSTSLPAKPITPTSSRAKSSGKGTGAFMCTCCPKKPKRFCTEDELRQHTTEKHYECTYCGNRFKNKNEAERHQNSLHLRRHSWSCAAIAGPEAAFHPTNAGSSSTSGSSATDSCGYCGQEFRNHPRPDWAARKDHLMVVHKFGECNKAKKFYRADHFRQHLKHSHAGSSGKWTNMLENACMKDEPPPDEASSPGEDMVGLTPASGVESLSTQDDESNE